MTASPCGAALPGLPAVPPCHQVQRPEAPNRAPKGSVTSSPRRHLRVEVRLSFTIDMVDDAKKSEL